MGYKSLWDISIPMPKIENKQIKIMVGWSTAKEISRRTKRPRGSAPSVMLFPSPKHAHQHLPRKAGENGVAYKGTMVVYEGSRPFDMN